MPSDRFPPVRPKGEGHRRRLRERFLKSGLDGFHDYEVVELLLTLATPRRDCKGAAKSALERFKTLRGVMEATPGELAGIKGIGPRNILGLRLMKAVLDRYLKQKIIGRVPLNNSRSFHDYLDASLGGRPVECVMAVFLDAKNRVIASKVIFEGTLTASSIYPREIVRAALDHHAAAIMLAHNHPSGDPRPSDEDMAITRRLIFASRVVDIVLHDHLIIGDNCYFSFADEGHITRLNKEVDNMEP